MIPLAHWPGHGRWGGAFEALVAHGGALWLFGEAGGGLSTFGRLVADQRGVAYMDDAERLLPEEATDWLASHPRGVFMAHTGPEAPEVAAVAGRCLAFRLPPLEEDAACVEPCARALAADLGLAGEPPSALFALPCPGNFRGLHNRLMRWKLLGQLPEPSQSLTEGPTLTLHAEDLATNLHALERLLLHRALRRSYGNRVEAAKRLGVSRRQLYLLIKRHGDPLRGEAPTDPGPQRLLKRKTPSKIE